MKNSPDTNSQADPKRFKHAVEYYFALVFLFALSFIPMGLLSWAGNRVGDLMRLILKKRRLVIEKQVREVLGLQGPELDAFVKANFRHYGNVVVEFARLRRMERKDFASRVDMNGFDKVVSDLKREGKGQIILTMHFGNWEWANAAIVLAGGVGGSIARPLDNPRVNELVRRMREKNGLRIFDKRGAIRKALGSLKDNGVVCILNDQDAGPGGTMSPFLGKPGSTLTVPMDLAIRTGAPITVGAVVRNPPGSAKRITIIYSPTIFRADPDADPEAEKRRLLDATNAELGKLIMTAPEQWFWIHRRWKSDGKR